MTTFSAALDLAAALAPPDRCPACHTAPLHPDPTETGVDFRCSTCHRHWHLELGRVRGVTGPESGRR